MIDQEIQALLFAENGLDIQQSIDLSQPLALRYAFEGCVCVSVYPRIPQNFSDNHYTQLRNRIRLSLKCFLLCHREAVNYEELLLERFLLLLYRTCGHMKEKELRWSFLTDNTLSQVSIRGHLGVVALLSMGRCTLLCTSHTQTLKEPRRLLQIVFHHPALWMKSLRFRKDLTISSRQMYLKLMAFLWLFLFTIVHKTIHVIQGLKSLQVLRYLFSSFVEISQVYARV